MKKTYIVPVTKAIQLNISNGLLAGSGGVGNGATVGNGFTGTDVSYGRDDDADWEDEEF